MAYSYSEPSRRTVHGKASRYWYVQRYHDETKRQTWVSLKVTSRRDAMAAVRKLRRDEAIGADPDDKPQDVIFDTAYSAWLAEKAGRVSKSYYATLKYAGDAFWSRHFGGKRLADVTRDDVNAYIAKRASGKLRSRRRRKSPEGARAALTVNVDLTRLGNLFTYSVRRGWIERSPVDGVQKLTGEMKRRVRSLTAEQEARLVAACRTAGTITVTAKRNRGGPRGGRVSKRPTTFEQTLPVPDYLAPLVVVALGSGFRKRTLLSLCWKHIDLEARRWTIPAELVKTKEDYHAPCPIAVVRELEAYRARLREECIESGAPILDRLGPDAAIFGLSASSTVRGPFARAAKRAGLDGMTLHDCRRIYLNKLRARGVSMETAMALTGHRQIQTVMKHYREIPDADLEAAVAALDGEHGEGSTEKASAE